jgi:hypothetical protein
MAMAIRTRPEYRHQLAQVILRFFIEAQPNTSINRDARCPLGPKKQALIDWPAPHPSADQGMDS